MTDWAALLCAWNWSAFKAIKLMTYPAEWPWIQCLFALSALLWVLLFTWWTYDVFANLEVMSFFAQERKLFIQALQLFLCYLLAYMIVFIKIGNWRNNILALIRIEGTFEGKRNIMSRLDFEGLTAPRRTLVWCFYAVRNTVNTIVFWAWSRTYANSRFYIITNFTGVLV